MDTIQRSELCGIGKQGRMQEVGWTDMQSIGCLKNAYCGECGGGCSGLLLHLGVGREWQVGPCGDCFPHCCDKTPDKSNVRKVYPASQFGGASVMTGKALQLEHESAGHVTSTVRNLGVVNAGVQFAFSL